MTANMIVLDPVAQPSNAPAKVQQVLDGLAGKTVGFIDNAKLNFNHLVDDLGELAALPRRGLEEALPDPGGV